MDEMTPPIIPDVPQTPPQPVLKQKRNMLAIFIAGFVCLIFLVVGIGIGVSSHHTSVAPVYTVPQHAQPTGSAAISSVVDPSTTLTQKSVYANVHSLPLGDNKVSTSPQVGYIYSCQTQFQGGGAQVDGSWITGTTWDPSKKIAVQGGVRWNDATVTLSSNGSSRVVRGNGLPVSQMTGIFPIASSDPAYQVDKNPNSIKTQQYSFSLPLSPVEASTASCVPGGMIGVATDGVAIFNGLDAGGRDAAAHEVLDSCGGHPQQEGMYHYHGPSPCMQGITDNNVVIGYAMDGFPITSMYDANGKELTNADLDACHGTTSEIVSNGQKVTTYHYVMTRAYPYSIGCFRGTPVSTGQKMGKQQSQTQQMIPSGQPPQGGPSGRLFLPPPGPPPSGIPPRN